MNIIGRVRSVRVSALSEMDKHYGRITGELRKGPKGRKIANLLDEAVDLPRNIVRNIRVTNLKFKKKNASGLVNFFHRRKNPLWHNRH